MTTNSALPMELADLYEAIIESTEAAIISKTLDGTILTWNGAATRIFGWTADEIIGRSIRTLIPADRQSEEDAIIARIKDGHLVDSFETMRLHKDGTQIPIAVLVSPVRDANGRIVAASKIARSISAEVAMRNELRESQERFRLLADNMSQLAWIAQPDGEIHWYNNRWYDYTGTDLEQMRGWGWQKVHHGDYVVGVTDRFRQCIASGTEWEDTFPLLGKDGNWRWFLSRAKPHRDESGRIVCWFGTNTDITEQREAERQIDLLLREVDHRAKNMLAVIQAVAKRTAAAGGDFLPRLEQRIAGLAASQDLLVRRDWHSVPLDELIDVQLRFLSDRRQQVSRQGPPALLAPSAAESIAMVFHEMATNAEKYGALSVREGRVAITWSLDDGPGGPMFALHWRESGGPPVVQPGTRGFGSQIISDVPRSKLRAKVTPVYLPEGFTWSLVCPADHVLVEAG